MKIHCLNPYHKDQTPSLHVYSDGAYCFTCGFRCNPEEAVGPEDLIRLKKEPENISERMEYIKSLPISTIRGLSLRNDNTGYYITWPNAEFYKKRLYAGKSRYLGPRGRKPPLFIYPKTKDTLILIEGELNAMTLGIANIPYSIASPGSATELSTHLPIILTYTAICLIVDRDAAGVAYGLELKNTLIKRGKKVTLNAVEKDANQVLQEEGTEGVTRWFNNLDLPEGMQAKNSAL